MITRGVVVLAVAALAAGCGGATQTAAPSSPTPTPSASAPTPSASTSTSPSGSPTPSPSSTPTATATTVAVYFLHDEHVTAVARTAHSTAVATEAVRALLAGPTAAESHEGLTSSIPAGTSLRSIAITGGTAVVDLSAAYGSGGGSLSMSTRLGQLVATLTQFPTVRDVRLWLDGKPAETLGGEGLVVDHPLGLADVESSLPAIMVNGPLPSSTVHSPMRVRGSANVFEAVFQIEVTDWDGRIVARQTVHATSGTGTRGTFDVTVPYTVDRAGHGELVVYTLSPRDGSRDHIGETPLLVAP